MRMVSRVRTPGTWLASDEVVALCRIIIRHERAKKNRHLHAYFLDSSFYQSLVSSEDPGNHVVSIDRAKRLIASAKDEFGGAPPPHGYVTPFNTGQHWCLLWIDTDEMCVDIYDPRGDDSISVARRIL